VLALIGNFLDKLAYNPLIYPDLHDDFECINTLTTHFLSRDIFNKIIILNALSK
jgi:hypothetical protein